MFDVKKKKKPMVCVYFWLLMLVRPTTCAQCHQKREGETVAAQRETAAAEKERGKDSDI